MMQTARLWAWARTYSTAHWKEPPYAKRRVREHRPELVRERAQDARRESERGRCAAVGRVGLRFRPVISPRAHDGGG